jgi:hypothetical protein
MYLGGAGSASDRGVSKDTCSYLMVQHSITKRKAKGGTIQQCKAHELKANCSMLIMVE